MLIVASRGANLIVFVIAAIVIAAVTIAAVVIVVIVILSQRRIGRDRFDQCDQSRRRSDVVLAGPGQLLGRRIAAAMLPALAPIGSRRREPGRETTSRAAS